MVQLYSQRLFTHMFPQGKKDDMPQLSNIYHSEEYRWQVYPENGAASVFAIYFSPRQVSVLSSVC